MQITLQNGDSIASVLAQFESKYFSVTAAARIDNEGISKLKEIADFLGNAFATTLEAPKRNSKASLALWIQRVLSGARELMIVSENAIAAPIEIPATEPEVWHLSVSKRRPLKDYQVPAIRKPLMVVSENAITEHPDSSASAKNYLCPQCNEWMDRSGFDEVLGSDFQEQLCKICGSEVLHYPEGQEAIATPTPTETPSSCPNCLFAHEPHQNTLCDHDPETGSTSGLVISFGKTLEYLPGKSVTRRTWKDTHAQKFIKAFNQNKLVKAFDKDIRYGGEQIGWCRLLCAPYKERLCDMPEEDLLAEGGMCSTIGEFIRQYFDGNPRLEVWVIRFDFISQTFASEDTMIAAPTETPAVAVEVLEPVPAPIYTISIHPDREANAKAWGFTREKVSALPPYLLDRQDVLFEKSSHSASSCDANYFQIPYQHLSNIATEHGQLIEFFTDDLVVYAANVHGNPPPYVIHNRAVFKRMTWGAIGLGTTVKYAQVLSEYLSNIAVVGAA